MNWFGSLVRQVFFRLWGLINYVTPGIIKRWVVAILPQSQVDAITPVDIEKEIDGKILHQDAKLVEDLSEMGKRNSKYDERGSPAGKRKKVTPPAGKLDFQQPVSKKAPENRESIVENRETITEESTQSFTTSETANSLPNTKQIETLNEVQSVNNLPQQKTNNKKSNKRRNKQSKLSKSFVPIEKELGRGIEGRSNSCYMDATLFSMFYYWKIFDSRFLDGNFVKDSRNETAEEITRLLNVIVDKLRGGYCHSEYVADLRSSMMHINSRIKSTMMDVDELISNLFGKALHLEPFIEYSIGAIKTKSYMHQIIINSSKLRKNGGCVKDLLVESMKMQGLMLSSLPEPAFIIKMPRSNGQLVGHKYILPNLTLNVEDVLIEDYNGISTLDLIAVIVLKYLHYTAFVRCGTELRSPWVYFNSMPANVSSVSEMGEQLAKFENLADYDATNVPGSLRTIMEDVHVCIYKPSEN